MRKLHLNTVGDAYNMAILSVAYWEYVAQAWESAKAPILEYGDKVLNKNFMPKRVKHLTEGEELHVAHLPLFDVNRFYDPVTDNRYVHYDKVNLTDYLVTRETKFRASPYRSKVRYGIEAGAPLLVLDVDAWWVGTGSDKWDATKTTSFHGNFNEQSITLCYTETPSGKYKLDVKASIEVVDVAIIEAKECAKRASDFVGDRTPEEFMHYLVEKVVSYNKALEDANAIIADVPYVVRTPMRVEML